MANKRLIDANALRERMFSYYSCVDENSSKEYYKGDTLMSYEVADMIEDCIDNAPTVDAVEVVHGKWVDRYGGKYANPVYDCSECKKSALFRNDMDLLGNWKSVQYLSDYCPNCGAKMDGGNEDV